MYEIQIFIDGQWCPAKPWVPEGCPPYRWMDKADAELWMGRLFTDVPRSLKKVQRV